MASKEKKMPGFMSVPELDYCTGRILSLANELEAMGYKPRTIARAALNAGLEKSRVNVDDHRPYLNLLERVGRETLATLDRVKAERIAAEAAMAAFRTAGNA